MIPWDWCRSCECVVACNTLFVYHYLCSLFVCIWCLFHNFSFYFHICTSLLPHFCPLFTSFPPFLPVFPSFFPTFSPLSTLLTPFSLQSSPCATTLSGSTTSPPPTTASSRSSPSSPSASGWSPSPTLSPSQPMSTRCRRTRSEVAGMLAGNAAQLVIGCWCCSTFWGGKRRRSCRRRRGWAGSITWMTSCIESRGVCVTWEDYWGNDVIRVIKITYHYGKERNGPYSLYGSKKKVHGHVESMSVDRVSLSTWIYFNSLWHHNPTYLLCLFMLIIHSDYHTVLSDMPSIL